MSDSPLDVWCPDCHAMAGQPCRGLAAYVVAPHPARVELNTAVT